jgi:hypothetical protein
MLATLKLSCWAANHASGGNARPVQTLGPMLWRISLAMAGDLQGIRGMK